MSESLMIEIAVFVVLFIATLLAVGKYDYEKKKSKQ